MPDGTNFDSASYEDQGPSFLASQPATLPENPKKSTEDWNAAFNHVEQRLSGLRNWRWSWWAHWMVLAEYFLPRRMRWSFISANLYNKGRPINDQIIDSTGLQAVNVCASGMWTGLTNPARPWFKLAIGDGIEIDAAAKDWMEDTERRVYTVLHKSNFYKTMAQAFQDVTVFGSAPVIIYEDSIDVIRCYLPCAGEYFLASGSRLSTDTLYREFTLTVAQIVDMFSLEKCPSDVRSMWEKGGAALDTEFVVCHAIEPNFPITSRAKGKAKPLHIIPKNFVFREVYWLRGKKGQQALSLRGFHAQPFAVARWSTTSNDPYGRSPCMDALGDNKQIQLETLRKAEFIEKGVRPPMGADPELKNEPASIIPGMITFASSQGGKKGFWPLFEVNYGWLQALVNDIAGVSERINRCLFVDVFMAITRMAGVQPRNELEITKRDLERLQVLGPFIDGFENEFASPCLMRVIEIMEKFRLLKPKPPSLMTHAFKIEYTSIMREAQRASEAISMRDVFATLGNLSAAAKAAGVPDPIRRFNLDKGAQLYSELVGYPQSAVFTDEEVAQHDQAREAGKAATQVLPTTMAGVSAAKTLADTPIQGGNALHALLSGSTQTQ